ncbi:MAG: carboxypeptidase M32 [archaeon]|nr:carboxypeptidase M32 [archaeon]
MFQNKTILDLIQRYRLVWAVGHASAVLNWDFETYMPPEGTRARAIANSELALLRQRFTLSLKELVGQAEKEDASLNEEEKGVLRVLKRQLDYYEKVPPELIEKLSKTRAEANQVWRIARKKSDFQSFKPHLEKLIELKREEAEKIGYEKHPYDALLDRNEEGLRTDDMDSIFEKLIPNLKRILAKVQKERTYPKRHELESVKYDKRVMESVNNSILNILDMPNETRFRMDISTHPFTTGFSLNDVRITTRYEGKDFRASMFATMHECGHAIYGLQVSQDLEYTPISGGASGGIHESQSRFIENVVGRSRDFSKVVTPMLKSKFKFLKKYDAEDLYYYFNLVRRSFIRVDADELTYNFHIAIRYQIEKQILGGEVSVSELPSIWSEKFKDNLGIVPKTDSQGVLQDIHWSGGGFGGFPSYTIGNVVDGMIWNNIRKEIDLPKTIRTKDIKKIKAFLGNKIHKWGSTFAPKDLLRKEFGESYNPDWLVQYLEQKYVG